jgi:hypothetical protein
VPERAALEPRAYGVGPLEIQPLVALGGTTSGGAGQVELVVRVGDLVGKAELLLVGSIAGPDGGAEGGRASVVTRAIPVTLGADLWAGGDDRLGSRRFGGLVSATRTLEGSGTRARLELGALADRALDEPALEGDELAVRAERAIDGRQVPERDLAFGEVGVAWWDRRSQALGVWTAARGQADVFDRELLWGQASAGVSLLRGGARTRATYTAGRSTRSGLDGFVLGGVPDTVIPDASQAFRVLDPAFAPDAWTGSRHDRAELSVGEPLAVFGVRHRFGDDALGSSGSSAVGLRLEQRVEAQPWMRLPATRVGAGVACRLETPGIGLDPRACQDVADFAAWGALTFGSGTE